MADNKERLIDKDIEAQEEEKSSIFASATFWFAIKLSLSIGLVASLITALIITNIRMSNNEEALAELKTNVSTLLERQPKLSQNVRQLHEDVVALEKEVNSLDIGAAKGDLRQALKILSEQSANIDKQLAVTRNGLISLSRMVKGSRVWQDDYRSQYQSLFDDNKAIKQSIEALRGIEKKKEKTDRYIELDF